jgi:type II secretory pathway component HofQ
MRKKVFFIVMLCVMLEKVFSVSYEFINQDITEILYSISLVEGISIVGDDTVSGIATFRFIGEDFESAFQSFLISNRLYVKKENNIWLVSKLNLEINEENYKEYPRYRSH